MGNEIGKMETGSVGDGSDGSDGSKMSEVNIAYKVLGYVTIDPEYKYIEILACLTKISDTEFVDTIVDLIKHYGYTDLFTSGLVEFSGVDAIQNMFDRDGLEAMIDEDTLGDNKDNNAAKIKKRFSALFEMHEISGKNMNYKKHSMFCRAFIKEFGFMPIISESQRGLSSEAYMSVVDAFDIYFAYIYESAENTKSAIVSSDYYAILKNYMANQKQFHEEVTEHSKWLGMIEFARDTFATNAISEDYITIPGF